MLKRRGSHKRRRVVLNTNTWVSAILFPKSVPGQLLRYLRGHGVLLASQEVLRELNESSRPKFDQYLALGKRKRILARLLKEVRLIKVSTHVKVCRDPKDDKFLDLAVAGKADAIITGDKDLLVLASFRSTQIVSAAIFLQTEEGLQ